MFSLCFRDCPELREKIRKVRMSAVEEVIRTNTSLLPHIKTWVMMMMISMMMMVMMIMMMIRTNTCPTSRRVCPSPGCNVIPRCIEEGTIIDNGQLICLYLLVSTAIAIQSTHYSYVQSEYYGSVQSGQYSSICKVWTLQLYLYRLSTTALYSLPTI